jgi:hypothetical protein
LLTQKAMTAVIPRTRVSIRYTLLLTMGLPHGLTMLRT